MMRTNLPTASTRTKAGPWLQDPADRRILLPNGITLDPTAFPAAVNGVQLIPSGTAVGRADDGLFGPAADTDTEIYLTWKDHDLIAEGPITEAVRGGAVFEGLLPAALSATVRSTLLARGFQFIPYDGAGIDE